MIKNDFKIDKTEEWGGGKEENNTSIETSAIPNYVTVDKAEGTGNGYVRVSVEENTELFRSFPITVVGGGIESKVQVCQEGVKNIGIRMSLYNNTGDDIVPRFQLGFLCYDKAYDKEIEFFTDWFTVAGSLIPDKTEVNRTVYTKIYIPFPNTEGVNPLVWILRGMSLISDNDAYLVKNTASTQSGMVALESNSVVVDITEVMTNQYSTKIVKGENAYFLGILIRSPLITINELRLNHYTDI